MSSLESDSQERIGYVNKILYNQECIQRKEDMSPDGTLSVFCQPDGDMVIQICDENNECVASAEFCTPMMGGGGSSRTWYALRNLFVAMYEDQLDPAQQNRAGRFTILEQPKEPS